MVSKRNKNLQRIGSFIITCGLVISIMLTARQFYLQRTIFAESFHFEVQEYANYYEELESYLENQLSSILSSYNVSSEIADDLVPHEAIRDVILKQTYELVGLYRESAFQNRGADPKFSSLDATYYLSVLDSRLLKAGYDIGYLKYHTSIYVETEMLLEKNIRLFQDVDQYQSLMRMANSYLSPEILFMSLVVFCLILIFIWRKDWLNTLFYFVLAYTISGFIMFVKFSYFHKVSLIWVITKVPNVIGTVLAEYFRQLNECGLYFVLSGILCLLIIMVCKELRFIQKWKH